MAIKKLVVVEEEIEGEITIVYHGGEKYSFFQDPETGKFYRPKKTFTVTGDDLESLFVEITERMPDDA